MNIRISSELNVFFRYVVFILIISGVKVCFGQQVESVKADNSLIMGSEKGAEFQLNVRDLPLSSVLENISSKTKVPIHYSVLPKGLVTATCVGSSLKKVIECLLDRKADLIVSYLNGADENASNGQLSEAWVLGSSLGDSAVQTDCTAMNGKSISLLNFEQNQASLEFDQTDALITSAQSKDSATRAEAISALLAEGRPGDPVVKATLEHALNDENENVRAQAISTLAHREGHAATQAIQEAMHDKSVDVRTMAVDSIIDDTALLQQAINDSDETIRILAATKLDGLNHISNTAP